MTTASGHGLIDFDNNADRISLASVWPSSQLNVTNLKFVNLCSAAISRARNITLYTSVQLNGFDHDWYDYDNLNLDRPARLTLS